ncbi:coiled-coil and C2 domain-containing protein 1-like [Tropilaelaps mercedesae]|uniref:Coiled-coil and C2 domain-containing protein 1-like n=1 Tax=Tropilaelaps mercedesae TaxID=418985 RepID=A0A1V9XN52_9ACAR|nr:coiled-coil and C2 domain-containing protein 1-like [Tropilaelaps mercedesae]
MSRKPQSSGPRRSGSGFPGTGGINLVGFGLMDINNLNFDNEDDDDIDDTDLETELDALMSGKRQKKREELKQKADSVDLTAIAAMASAAMKDDLDDGNVDLEGIENDDELLAELNELNNDDKDEIAQEAPQPIKPKTQLNTVLRPPNLPIYSTSTSSSKNTPSPVDITVLLAYRLQTYQIAEEAVKSFGDETRARRYSRAIKTLESQLKQAQLGKAIPENDIPPPVTIHGPLPMELPKDKSAAPSIDETNDVLESGQKNEAVRAILCRSGTYPPVYIADALGNPDDIGDTTSDQPQTPILVEEALTSLPSSSISKPPQSTLPQAHPSQIPSRPSQATLESSAQSQESLLTTRREQYRKAALVAKHSGNHELAIQYVRVAKQIDVVLQALLEGKPVDLVKMPPSPPRMAASVSRAAARPTLQPEQEELIKFIDMNAKTDPTVYKAPAQAQTILGALEQRLAKYKEAEMAAKEKSDASRVRRLGRIIKDYQDAIKAHKAGKRVDFQDLPVPPGFDPISTMSIAESASLSLKTKAWSASGVDRAQEYSEAKPMVLSRPSTPASAVPSPPKQSVKRQMSTTIEKQKQFLLERQRLFKEAAKEALKNGASKEQAMEYVRMMKGIKPMLQATESGLPVDLNSIPVPPQLQQDFVILDKKECEYELPADSEELYRTLEQELEEQYNTCMTNKEHFFKLGDVGSGTKFEKLAQDTQKDLTVLKASWKRGDRTPRFRYEDRVFTIVRHNHNVAENVMQVSVIRGITLPGKFNELDTYVKVDFAYPADAPQSQRCSTFRDTTNPAYDFTCCFEVSRKSRSFLRALKRVQLKIEVWSKRGFLRADGLLGVASVKLVDLETKCDLHEVFPVMDGRRDTGGKLEVKVQVSEPFSTRQIEEIKKRWLVIGP